MQMAIVPTKSNGVTLVDLIDRILDKGLVINADITVSIAGIELLGIKIRAAVASFETAARYGLEFPSGTNLSTNSWKTIECDLEACPNCNKRLLKEDLINSGCPWCGWSNKLSSGIKIGED